MRNVTHGDCSLCASQKNMQESENLSRGAANNVLKIRPNYSIPH